MFRDIKGLSKETWLKWATAEGPLSIGGSFGCYCHHTLYWQWKVEAVFSTLQSDLTCIKHALNLTLTEHLLNRVARKFFVVTAHFCQIFTNQANFIAHTYVKSRTNRRYGRYLAHSGNSRKSKSRSSAVFVTRDCNILKLFFDFKKTSIKKNYHRNFKNV